MHYNQIKKHLNKPVTITTKKSGYEHEKGIIRKIEGVLYFIPLDENNEELVKEKRELQTYSIMGIEDVPDQTNPNHLQDFEDLINLASNTDLSEE